jgi:D-galactarolactone cycloisomerase
VRIHEITAYGLRGCTPEGGWSNELQPDDCVHTIVKVDTDALEPERVSEKLRQNTFWLGRGGSITHTIVGIDIALWDLLGKACGQPVGRLLGGRCRERIRPLRLTTDA